MYFGFLFGFSCQADEHKISAQQQAVHVSGNQTTFTLSNVWNYIEPWIDKQKFAFTTFSLLIGCVFLYTTFTKDKVSSEADLRPIEGTLSSYSFVDGKRGTKQYYIWLKEFPQTFQIPADFLTFLNKKSFESEVRRGETLLVKISKFTEKELANQHAKIIIYELNKEGRNFLNSNLTIKQENSPIFYYAGTGFILAGFCFYFYKKRRL